MSLPWWKGPGADPIVSTSAAGAPQLLPERKAAIGKEIESLIRGYTPEWTNRGSRDAGAAFATLYAELTAPIRTRLNRLPEKMLVEYLDAAGIDTDPPMPATALLTFELAPAATGTVVIPEGFQVGAKAAGGVEGIVIFETDHTIIAVPLTIADLFLQKGTIFSPISLKSSPLLPFGAEARAGWSLCLGLSGTRPVDVRGLSVGFDVAEAPGLPPPASSGGSVPLPVPPPPALAWEFYDGESFRAAEVIRDSTSNLARSGAIDLRIPSGWPAAKLPGVVVDARHWIRLRLVYGRFAAAPAMTAIRLNVVNATATRTIRNEILQPVTLPSSPTVSQMRLEQRPVLPGSLILEIDETGGLGEPDASGQRWTEITDLNEYDSSSNVFTLDPEAGVLTFGDGVRGRALPLGFRHVRAIRYRVSSGRAGAVPANAITQPISSAPFVSKITNPRPAVGGVDAELRADTIARGPQQIRAQGRAVAAADYELLALRSGASITRAHAVDAHHPQYRGSRIPGIVGVFVVPLARNEGPPVADAATLAAVASHLAHAAAPAGVEIVTAATRFHRVRAELGVIIHPDFSTAAVMNDLIDRINAYIDHVKGGDDGRGWPFGGPLRYSALLQRLLRAEGVTAIPRLNLVVDGRRLPFCADYLTPQHELLWPESHEVVPEERQ
jgi:predicted phage baseplate assembly protein